MKLFGYKLGWLSQFVALLGVVTIGYTPPVSAEETDNDHVVITVKESPAFVNRAGKVVKASEGLEKVCLSLKLAMLLRTDLETSQAKEPDSPPQVTYFPMLDGVRILHTDLYYNPNLTCATQGGESTLRQLLEALQAVYSVDVQVCWDCWISRYGSPIAAEDASNPVVGGWNGTDNILDFLGAEQMAIQEMFNNADKVVDFD